MQAIGIWFKRTEKIVLAPSSCDMGGVKSSLHKNDEYIPRDKMLIKNRQGIGCEGYIGSARFESSLRLYSDIVV